MRGIIDAARTKAIDVLHRSGLKLANSPARVVHAESGLPVGEDERLEEYSEITSALVELAQACMIERAKMKWYVLDDRSSKDEAPEVTQEVTTGAPGSGAASSGCRGKFLATSDWRLNKHLLIVIPGTGAVRAGVWGRQLCLVDSLEHGTALSVVSWAANEKGWGVVGSSFPSSQHPTSPPTTTAPTNYYHQMTVRNFSTAGIISHLSLWGQKTHDMEG